MLVNNNNNNNHNNNSINNNSTSSSIATSVDANAAASISTKTTPPTISTNGISNNNNNSHTKQRQSSITSLFRSNSNQETSTPSNHSRTNSNGKKINFNFKNPFKTNTTNSTPTPPPPSPQHQHRQHRQQQPTPPQSSYLQIPQLNLHHLPSSKKSHVPRLNLKTDLSKDHADEVGMVEEEEEEEEDDDDEEEEDLEDEDQLIKEFTEEDDGIDSSSESSNSSASSTASSVDSQSFEEDEKDYCYGGYHPTYIGEIYGEKNNYQIVRKLGWGHFSTVWLAFDTNSKSHVALKIVRSAKHYTEAALDEVNILQAINNGNDNHPGKNHLVKLLDNFIIKGPNGEHVCMVLEVLGENMLNLIKKFKNYQKINKMPDVYGGLPLPLVKHITRQLLLLVDYLHVECGLIHTDIKPENVLIEIKDVEKLLKLIDRQDNAKKKQIRAQNSKKIISRPPLHRSRKSVSKFGESPIKLSKPLQSPISTEEIFHRSSVVSTPTLIESKLSSLKIDEEDEEVEEDCGALDLISIKIADLGNACWTNLHYTDDIQTRQYRSPEIILGGDWGCSTDIWSLGCLIFELITSDYLFDPKNGPNYDRDDDHLAQIVELLNEWPTESFLQNCEFAKKFISTSSKQMRLKKIKNLKIWTLDNVLMEKYHLNIRNSFEVSRFIKCFLRIEPWERMDCGSLMNHEWLQSGITTNQDDLKLNREYGTKGEYIRGWCSLVT